MFLSRLFLRKKTCYLFRKQGTTMHVQTLIIVLKIAQPQYYVLT